MTISKWIKKFVLLFQLISKEKSKKFNLKDSDEWHCDETVIFIDGIRHYLWIIFDSETRYVIDFHLSPFRDYKQAFSLISNAYCNFGKPKAIVSDRYYAYDMPIKTLFFGSKHIKVASFQDDIINNVLGAFNGQFKALYKTKLGFSSFQSANSMIATYIFAYNFIRPHSSLNNLSPAEVAFEDIPMRVNKQQWLLV